MQTKDVPSLVTRMNAIYNKHFPGGIPEAIRSTLDDENAIALTNGSIKALIGQKPPMRFVLLVDDNKEEVISSHALLQVDNILNITITEINEDDGLVAFINGVVNDVPISFYDSLYFLNKNKYTIGLEYKFHIAALAVSMKKRTEEVQFTAKSGPFKGQIFDTSEMTSLIQNDEGSFEYCFPFDKFIEHTEVIGLHVYKCNFNFRNIDNEYFNIPVFVNERQLIEYQPEKNDSVAGVILLHGYLIDSY